MMRNTRARRSWTIPLSFALSIASPWLAAQEPADQGAAAVVSDEVVGEPDPVVEEQMADRTAIQAAIESYVKAFNEADVEKVAEHWTEEGVYIDASSGTRVAGRAALVAGLNDLFAKSPSLQLAVATESIEFISPGVALERGSAVLQNEDAEEVSTYRCVYVERDGQWLIDRMTEEVVERPSSHAEQLKPLEFLVGRWIASGDGWQVTLDGDWTVNENFISRKYNITIEGEVDSSGLQIIGWNAATQEICSWLFDSDGGVVKGVWEYHDDHWVVQSVATLADGSSGSFASVLTPLGPDEFTWQKINQVIDGKILPNTDEVTVTRQ